ncbi:B12-binding domain-containing radical SAM protein [Candidatus Amarolinea aalborgensis]|uniref:B12-binding domain-containing radical SAM protein n=1 Tax=Candidatus Amarolinea aalborgensis TaxID=2249329 RepID=UPI003BF9A518
MAASRAGERVAAADLGSTATVWDGPVLVVEDVGQQRLPARHLVAALEEAGWPARLVDLMPGLNDPASLITLVRAVRPRLVVFSILFASHVPETLALIAALRQAAVASHVTLTGHLPFFAAAELLAACPGLDSVVAGEAEVAAVALAGSLPASERWQTVPGLVFRGSAGGVVRTAPSTAGRARYRAAVSGRCEDDRGVDDGVDATVSLAGALDRLPLARQPDPLPTWGGVGFATLEASRGCYHACAFCLPCAFYRALGPAYRLRGIPHLVDEIEALVRRGARLFLFDDEQFLPPHPQRAARVAAFGDELARRRLTIAFTLKCRADDVESELFRQLRDMGLRRVYVGIESGCQATLDHLAKGVGRANNLTALQTLADLGIVADFRCLLFHPWSTWGTVAEDMAFCRQVAPLLSTLLDWREVEVYPGTGLARRLRCEARAAGDPWPLSYAVPDARAELLRRVNRVVVGAAPIFHACQAEVTAAWFELLLARRFRPSDRDMADARRLQAIVQQGNLALLAVWERMLEFSAQVDIGDAAPVNAAAAAWAAAVSLACLEIQRALAARAA